MIELPERIEKQLPEQIRNIRAFLNERKLDEVKVNGVTERHTD